MQRGAEQLGRDGAGAMAKEIGDLLATAVDLHRRGLLNQAATLYRTILSVDADNPDALHLLGVLAHTARDSNAARDLIARAVALRPDVPQYHFNLGVAQQAL